MAEEAYPLTPPSNKEDFVFEHNVVRSLRMLVSGASLILVGLATAVLITPGTWWIPRDSNLVHVLNLFGEPFPSGWPYVVTSVSASVADWGSSPGKIFRCSVLTGAIMIFVSDYPNYLSNVTLPSGNGGQSFPIINSLRAIMIPAGIMVVSLCPIAQVNLMTWGENIVEYGFHMAGALGAIIVFLICEFTDLSSAALKLPPMEKTIRLALAWLTVVSLVIFVIAEAIGVLGFGMCCDDVYLAVNHTAIKKAHENGAFIQEASDKKLMQLFHLNHLDPASSSSLYKGLYDTAHGPFLVARILGVWSEFFIFIWMLISHLAVWYFSPQRQQLNIQLYSKQ